MIGATKFYMRDGDIKEGLLIVKEYHTPTGRMGCGYTYIHAFTLKRDGRYICIETGCIQNGWPIHGSYFGEVFHDKKRMPIKIFIALMQQIFEDTYGRELDITTEKLLENLVMEDTESLFVCLCMMAIFCGIQACWLWKWKSC